MKIENRKLKICLGFTLPEVMVSVAIITALSLGTLCYQYQGVRHSRIAQAQVSATRISQLLLEDWKSTGGDADYDPESLGLGFTASLSGEYGDCKITLDNQTFYVELVQQLAPIPNNPDPVAGVTINQISVTVKWRKDFTQGAVGSSDPTICLTTYVRRDT